jgi:probable rRNA maturation factor
MPDGDRRPRLRVVCTDRLGRPVRAAGLDRWLTRVAPARARGIVTIALVSDADMRLLNRRYRRKNRATDVLSFPAAAGRSTAPRRRRASGLPAEDGLLGDIVIARGVAAAQARSTGHTLDAELRILALHGLLHLLGYDHHRDSGQMRRLEARLLARGGLPPGLIERARAKDRR